MSRTLETMEQLQSWWQRRLQFQTFNDPALVQVLREVAILVDEERHGRTPRWLTLGGNSGVGKTHVARGVFRWFREIGCRYTEQYTGATLSRPVNYVAWQRLVDEARGGDYSYFTQFALDHFVVVDDIGTESGTDFTKEQLSKLLAVRERRWSLFTCNLTLDQIAKLDVRFADRLVRNGNKFLNVVTKSYALRK